MTRGSSEPTGRRTSWCPLRADALTATATIRRDSTDWARSLLPGGAVRMLVGSGRRRTFRRYSTRSERRRIALRRLLGTTRPARCVVRPVRGSPVLRDARAPGDRRHRAADDPSIGVLGFGCVVGVAPRARRHAAGPATRRVSLGGFASRPRDVLTTGGARPVTVASARGVHRPAGRRVRWRGARPAPSAARLDARSRTAGPATRPDRRRLVLMGQSVGQRSTDPHRLRGLVDRQHSGCPSIELSTSTLLIPLLTGM